MNHFHEFFRVYIIMNSVESFLTKISINNLNIISSFFSQVIWTLRLTDRIEKYLLTPHFKHLLPEQVSLVMTKKSSQKWSWKKNTMLSTNPKVHHHRHLWSPPKVRYLKKYFFNVETYDLIILLEEFAIPFVFLFAYLL